MARGCANPPHQQPLSHLCKHWWEYSYLYDSCYSGKLSTDLSHQLALLYKLKSSFGGNGTPVLPVNIPSIPQQEGSKDCGTFAIAYTYHAARNDDINTIFFNQDLIRKHLEKCFCQGKMSQFPHDKYRSKFVNKQKRQQLKLFCECLMPETWDEMVMCDQCEEWHHLKCVGLQEARSKEVQWLCKECV